MKSCKVFLVDYDDCFHPTNVLYEKMWREKFAEFGISLVEATWIDMNMRNQLPGDYLAERTGLPTSIFTNVESQVRAAIKKLPLNDGAIEMIKRAKAAGAKVVLWTQAPQAWVFDTAPVGSLDYFDDFIFEAGKPSAHSVFQASKKFDCEICEIQGIDNGGAGLKALVSAGATAHHYKVEGEPEVRIDGVASVTSLRDVDVAGPVRAQHSSSSLEAAR